MRGFKKHSVGVQCSQLYPIIAKEFKDVVTAYFKPSEEPQRWEGSHIIKGCQHTSSVVLTGQIVFLDNIHHYSLEILQNRLLNS